MKKHLMMAALVVAGIFSRAMADDATSKPAIDLTGPKQTMYGGKPVTEDWVRETFATYGKNLYKRDSVLLNVVDANYDDGGRLISPKAFFDPGVRNSVGIDLKGKICKLENSRVKAKEGEETYLISRDREPTHDFRLISKEVYITGAAIKGTLFVCTRSGTVADVMRNGQLTYVEVPPVFLEVKPATYEDFVRFLGTGNKITSSYKLITEDEAKDLKSTEYKISERTDPAKYYKAVYVQVPIPTN